MVFSSLIFLFLFLPVFLIFYCLSPNKVKNFILLIFSLLFYTWGEGWVVLILLASSLVDFSAGLLIDKGQKKIGVAISLIFNLGILLIFKYLNFTFENIDWLIDTLNLEDIDLKNVPEIALPIGISFYTFQTMSYTIDVYRGKVKANKNFLEFITYVTMFPQLVAGPIVRYSDIQLKLSKRKISLDQFSEGVERFIIGLAKKVLIANSFANVADNIFAQNLADISTGLAWVGIIAYTIQIYYDFSGYSDMAIGLGKMLGFDFPENFNFPYISKSIREFWRRWHITLSTWFRDYVYISLGGNRKGKIITYINLLIVFFVTGFWHGASWNFLIWGLFHGFFIVIERMGFEKVLQKLWYPVQHFYAVIVVVIAWVFFRADDLNTALLYLKKMFVYDSANIYLGSYLTYIYIDFNLVVTFIIAIIFAMPTYPFLLKKYNNKVFNSFRSLVIMLLFLLSIVYLVSDSYNPFIYFRF